MAQNETHLSSDDQKIIHIRITLPGEEVISIPVTPIQETSSVIKVENFFLFFPDKFIYWLCFLILESCSACWTSRRVS